MIIGTRYYDSAGGFNEEVNIIRKRKLKVLMDNVKKFYTELQNSDFEDLSLEKIGEYLVFYKLTVDELKSLYHEDTKVFYKSKD